MGGVAEEGGERAGRKDGMCGRGKLCDWLVEDGWCR